jgi:hypothetical protein
MQQGSAAVYRVARREVLWQASALFGTSLLAATCSPSANSTPPAIAGTSASGRPRPPVRSSHWSQPGSQAWWSHASYLRTVHQRTQARHSGRQPESLRRLHQLSQGAVQGECWPAAGQGQHPHHLCCRVLPAHYAHGPEPRLAGGQPSARSSTRQAAKQSIYPGVGTITACASN